MRNSSSLDWLRFMHTPNDYRVSQIQAGLYQNHTNTQEWAYYLFLTFLRLKCFPDVSSKNG